jgi:glucose/arabinose dehydrogenase
MMSGFWIPARSLMPRFIRQRWFAVLVIILAMVAVGWQYRGKGYKSYLLAKVITPHPVVRATRPGLLQEDVDPTAFVAADVELPNVGHGVDDRSLSDASVALYRDRDHQLVPAIVNTTGGGDALVLQPIDPLDPQTRYTFEVQSTVHDTGGMAFRPYRTSFTTGVERASVNFPGGFEKIPQEITRGMPAIGVTIGPDHRLYSTTVDGRIFRYDIAADGTLSHSKMINVVQRANWGPRMIPGIKFDPTSTAEHLVAWITHSQFSFDSGDDWTGKISRLSGPDLEKYEDIVVGLPRSIRDHITGTMEFGPDGAIYFGQASNSAMGSADAGWGKRSEHLLNAAILRLDPTKISHPPLDVKTEAGGSYDPTAADAPLTLYATGTRNAFDIVFHSNGSLYAPVNGSAAGGNTPGFAGGAITGFRTDLALNGPYTMPAIPALMAVPQTQHDFLYRIEKGGYYGHPNPPRNEYVLNGGNPTAAVDPAEVPAYPVGTQPDRNYRHFAYDFGQNLSPDGIIEYKSNVFGGALKGKLLVTRYSGGKDIIALPVNSDGSIGDGIRGILGFTQLVNPIGLVEDTSNGNIYVAEFGAQRISLLRPLAPGAHAAPAASRLLFSDIVDGHASLPQKISIRNAGTQMLEAPANGITITGPDAAEFGIVGLPNTPVQTRPGRSLDVLVTFNAQAGGGSAIRTATLTVATNDAAHPVVSISLRGLAVAGTAGEVEPSLQHILDLHELHVTVGDPDPATNDLGYSPIEPNDEVTAQLLQKALPDSVTIEPLACFAPSSSPVVSIGWYDPTKSGANPDFNSLFNIDAPDHQSVSPVASGTLNFDPGEGPFGLQTLWPAFSGRAVYSQDKRNTFQPNPAHRRAIRFYQLRNPDGKIVPHTLLFAVEATPDAADQQDLVGLIHNVKPAPDQ